MMEREAARIEQTEPEAARIEQPGIMPVDSPLEPTETVLLIGSRGTIGSELRALLRARPGLTVLEAGRSPGNAEKMQLDICSIESIQSLGDKIPAGVQHVVVCCGAPASGIVSNLDSGTWTRNLTDTFIAVTRLVIMLANGAEVCALRPMGSITVTAGPSSPGANNMWGPVMAAANAGIEAFVRNAGVGLPRGIRCNAVSPASMVRETAIKAGLPLENTVTAAECAAAFMPLIFSDRTGEVVTASGSGAAPPVSTAMALVRGEPGEQLEMSLAGGHANSPTLSKKRPIGQDAAADVHPWWGFV